MASAEEEEQGICFECQEKAEAQAAAKLRKTVWYGRFKWLAEAIRDMGIADTLRIFHSFLDGNDKYGSITIASSAKKSLEQVIQDLQLDDTGDVQLPEKICEDSTIAVERR
jgi:hypothetical protein